MIVTAFRKALPAAPVFGIAITMVLAVTALPTAAAPPPAVPAPLAGSAAPAVSAAQPPDDDGFSIAALAWEQDEVDARAGDTQAALRWTIVDDDPQATMVAGEVSIRLADAQTREYIGEAYDIDYSTAGCCDDAELVEGDARRSSYRAMVPIPQYAGRPVVTWIVTKVTAVEQGEESDPDEAPEVFTGEDLSDFDVWLRARTLVDTTPPTLEKIEILNNGFNVNPYLYVNGAAASKSYGLRARDPQSGFWKGVLELTGPTGQTARSAFELKREHNSGWTPGCDGARVPRPTGSTWCAAVPLLPADAAEGTWRVSGLTLVDSAGNQTTLRDPRAPDLTVTGNRTLRATGIAATPTEVDNWRVARESTLTMTVIGAVGGLEHVEVMVNWVGGGCYATGGVPALRPDGTVGIPIVLEPRVDECHIRGLVLRDGAGQLAVYGEETNGPALDIALTRRPDPIPPQIGTAVLEPATVSLESAPTAPVTLTVTTDIDGAPLELAFVSLYDPDGKLVCGSTAERYPDEHGVLAMRVYIRPDITPGIYTVGVEFRDTLDQTREYGGPNGEPMPGGPLTLTITA